MDFLIPALVSFIATASAVFPTMAWAKKYNLVNNPSLKPHPAHTHNRVIPSAGGLPIYIGIAIAILFFIPFDKAILGIVLGSLILLITGLWDDRRANFSPFVRLLLQFLAALVVVISGVGMTYITNPLGGILRFDQIIVPVQIFGFHKIILLADLLALFWIVWVINMVNWSWGVDGQMPGIITISALVMGYISMKFFLAGDLNQLNIAKLSFITAGSALAFLIFNWQPAKIFPGDSGSNILGFMVAVLAILSGAKLAAAILVLLVPAVDFVYTFIRRVASGHSPFLGDKKHLHHLLLRRGWSHRRISLFYILGSAILGAIAISLNSRGKLFAAVLVSIIVLGGILWLNLFGGLSKPQDPDNG